ncbi:MAG: hypothetical protein GF405_06525, partial [Candidatus Eisenbacteria bacterium]|nr:hypothetical protein [Candidatus Eisenbacteria bacterium]
MTTPRADIPARTPNTEGRTMRVLLIHADRFSYHVTEKTSAVSKLAELDESAMKGSVDEALVAFLASEKADERNVESVATQAAKTITDQARELGAPTVMLYPYAHLSSDLSSPRVATKALTRIRELMEAEEELEIREAPFGFYKGFDIVCKGHPLSELAKTILPGEEEAESTGDESEALKAEEILESDWRVMTPDGGNVPATEFKQKMERGFRAMYNYELEGSRAVGEPPA